MREIGLGTYVVFMYLASNFGFLLTSLWPFLLSVIVTCFQKFLDEVARCLINSKSNPLFISPGAAVSHRKPAGSFVLEAILVLHFCRQQQATTQSYFDFLFNEVWPFPWPSSSDLWRRWVRPGRTKRSSVSGGMTSNQASGEFHLLPCSCSPVSLPIFFQLCIPEPPQRPRLLRCPVGGQGPFAAPKGP